MMSAVLQGGPGGSGASCSFPAVPLGGIPNWILSLVHPEGGPRRTTPQTSLIGFTWSSPFSSSARTPLLGFRGPQNSGPNVLSQDSQTFLSVLASRCPSLVAEPAVPPLCCRLTSQAPLRMLPVHPPSTYITIFHTGLSGDFPLQLTLTCSPAPSPDSAHAHSVFVLFCYLSLHSSVVIQHSSC